MGADGLTPVIIKKVKKGGGDGHHGGAWKVAYADFVTAMMAFFMLMWLLNATTEKQRKGIADYFSPTIPVHRVSGGGDGMGGGDSVFTEETLAQNGTGGSLSAPSSEDAAAGATAGDSQGAIPQEVAREEEEIQQILEELAGSGGESFATDNPMKHVLTRVTDEGLIVEIFDLPGEPLFLKDTADPTETLQEISDILTGVFALVENQLAINGHIMAHPVVLAHNPAWGLSSARATSMRLLMENSGFAEERTQRISGFADRKLVALDPMSVRNNRLELILLRSDQPE
ncbi:OmpA/MotB family protein [Halocynthiibacter styelae]|uniref:Chemotaxis protein MotB n=1 Tax=Halocynthiibacter styelae TaxID=2761955 RepID=A0A8J7IDG5_9RHOB|nr:flagellar motor protein MotB [Paenihalocynthiibacter styelae]MBI1493739.1 chemotaxis protein MotB [Paenihalocynthiibacter styelae]